ncbi:hypothetical protein BVRB_7g159070 [Beta vulgaris subsp. vulgaris]|nr:hypothetical protein BVRB_7g159070 [Beta vulgaris subsp. vulgaris]
MVKTFWIGLRLSEGASCDRAFGQAGRLGSLPSQGKRNDYLNRADSSCMMMIVSNILKRIDGGGSKSEMAEAVVNVVIQNLVPWLVHEATFLRGIHGDISEVIDELQSIQSFIKDADEKAEKDEDEISYSAKTWVKKLREVAYQIEDVTDSYVLQIATEAADCEQCHPKLLGSVARLMCWIVRLKPRHEMRQQIIQVKQRINGIKEDGKSYGFSRSSSSSVLVRSSTIESRHDRRASSLFIEEAEVVGIEGDREHLVDWLVNGETKRAVFSIVGMGGLGKTTLARKVYDSQIVINHFSNQAWVTVSQSYKVEELLKKTLKHFYKKRKESPPPQIENMDETLLMFELREYLKQKKYMVVFDDVWSVEFWEFIRHALPDDNSQGSRVLITTRYKEVAHSCKTSSYDRIYKLNRLPEEKALELFCKKVFYYAGSSSNDVIQVPPELKELANNIVRRCEGLPLAIVAIAGLLSTKRKEVIEWQELEKNLGSELLTNLHLSSMTRILSLSYYELPYYLKLCLLYFGMLPEDYSIRHARLIRLWIAEGFVKGVRGKSVEQVAKEYLVELINRSLVQVSRLDVDEKIRTIRVHDLMREIILSKSEELRYGHVWTDENSSSCFDHLARRLSIHGSCTNDNFLKNTGNGNGNGNGKCGTRSLLIFDVDKLPDSVLRSYMKMFKLLKVLDLLDAPISFLPEQVGDLYHLRYLSLRNTNTKQLPNSIGRLHNLQTLDLKCSCVHALPAEVKRLHNLLYLIGYCYDYETDFSISAQRGLKLKKGFGRLQNLQKLYLVEANHGITVLKELRKLKQLRKLGITKLPTQNGKILCESIASMTHLQSLEVCSEGENETLDLQFMSSPQFLQRLYLKGRLQKIPDWIPKLNNLVTLSIMWSGLMIDPLHILQHLPILSELVFQDTFLGQQLVFEAHGFQKLKILKLYDMNTLTNLTIEKGALPSVQLLKIGPIPKLNSVPTGIQYLTDLASLRFYDVSKEFALRLLPHQGQDFWVVQHVQTLLFHFQIHGERYKTCTLNELDFLCK